MELHYGDPLEAGMSPARIHRLTRLTASWVEQGMTPSLVVLVARRGVIVLHEAFGALTPDPDSPPLPRDAIFPISSISKPFTAAAAMILVNDGLLGLNRPVQEYVPEFVGEGKGAVMVHHLLTHTSGLRDESLDTFVTERLGSGRLSAPPDIDDPRASILPAIQHFSQGLTAPLAYRPGAEMSYCNYGYRLLGEVIERVCGCRLSTFAQNRLFDPLDMGDTSFGVPDSKRRRFVRRRRESPLGFLDDADFVRSFGPAGGMCSTAFDLAKFGQMILNRGRYGDNRILSGASVAEMTRNQTPGVSASFDGQFFPESSWGLGWDVHGGKRSLRDPSLYSPSAVSHSGGGSTYLVIDPELDLVAVYLSVHLGAHPSTDTPLRRADLFVNAAIAAIEDAST
jgi:CubicO group peptidase (beta-lactamase class C family)